MGIFCDASSDASSLLVFVLALKSSMEIGQAAFAARLEAIASRLGSGSGLPVLS